MSDHRPSSGIIDPHISSAIQADRKRVSTILAHPAAKGREALAKVLAMNANLDVEAAVGVLNAAPRAGASVAKPLKPLSGFDWEREGRRAARALLNVGVTNIGLGRSKDDKGASPVEDDLENEPDEDEDSGDEAPATDSDEDVNQDADAEDGGKKKRKAASGVWGRAELADYNAGEQTAMRLLGKA